jgi:hypothetical protein
VNETVTTPAPTKQRVSFVQRLRHAVPIEYTLLTAALVTAGGLVLVITRSTYLYSQQGIPSAGIDHSIDVCVLVLAIAMTLLGSVAIAASAMTFVDETIRKYTTTQK